MAKSQRKKKQQQLEVALKEDIEQEIGTLYAQTQVLLQSAKEEQAKGKEHNDSMTTFVNLKHKEITAIGDEVAKLKESNAQLDALTQAKDASLRAFMVEQKGEIDQTFHAHDAMSSSDSIKSLTVESRAARPARAKRGAKEPAASAGSVRFSIHEIRNFRLCRRRTKLSNFKSGGTTA